MAPQKLVVFKHQSALGNALAHKLFERVTVVRKPGVEAARSIADYQIAVNTENLPPGVQLLELI